MAETPPKDGVRSAAEEMAWDEGHSHGESEVGLLADAYEQTIAEHTNAREMARVITAMLEEHHHVGVITSSTKNEAAYLVDQFHGRKEAS